MFKYVLFVIFMALSFAGASVSKATMKDNSGSGKVTVIVKHEVKEYSPWRKVYDADLPNRKAHGFKVSGVYTDVKNPNMVTIIGQFASEEAANAFITSPELKEAMGKAGVVGAPEVTILRFMSNK
jgi:quinol monooxygenase YgiN